MMTKTPDPIDMRYGYDPTKPPADGIGAMVFDAGRAWRLTSVVAISAPDANGDVQITMRGRVMVDLDDMPDAPPPDPVPDPDPVPPPPPDPDPGPVTPPPVPTPPVIGKTVALDSADLIAKMKALGPGSHTIGVADGHHAPCVISGVNTGGAVTVVAENPGKAIFERLHAGSGTKNIIFDGLHGMPKGKVLRNSNNTQSYCFMALRGSANITFQNGTIRGRSDADGCAFWAKIDWQEAMLSGIQFVAPDCVARNIRLEAVNFGIGAETGAPRALIENISGKGFSGDGVRVNDNDVTVRGISLTDFVRIDANHPDALQAYGKLTNGVYAPLYRLTVEDFEALEWTENPWNDLRLNPDPGMSRYGIMQGIGLHTGNYYDIAIRRVKIGTAHANGFVVKGVNGLVIEDCTAFSIDRGNANYDARYPWIDLAGQNITQARNVAEGFRGAAVGAKVSYPVA